MHQQLGLFLMLQLLDVLWRHLLLQLLLQLLQLLYLLRRQLWLLLGLIVWPAHTLRLQDGMRSSERRGVMVVMLPARGHTLMHLPARRLLRKHLLLLLLLLLLLQLLYLLREQLLPSDLRDPTLLLLLMQLLLLLGAQVSMRGTRLVHSIVLLHACLLTALHMLACLLLLLLLMMMMLLMPLSTVSNGSWTGRGRHLHPQPTHVM
jgi:hypothetical protein